MLDEALLFLLDVLLQPYAALLLLRFHAVWLRAPLRNPPGEFVMVLTDFLVLPMRRHIPTAWGLDSASLLLAWGVETLYLTALVWVQGVELHGLPLLGLLAWAGVKLLKLSVYLLIIAVLVQALLSWLHAPTPLSPLLDALTRPFLQPLRRRLPPVAHIDLSPLALFILCQLLLIVPLGWLERLALGLLT